MCEELREGWSMMGMRRISEGDELECARNGGEAVVDFECGE